MGETPFFQQCGAAASWPQAAGSQATGALAQGRFGRFLAPADAARCGGSTKKAPRSAGFLGRIHGPFRKQRSFRLSLPRGSRATPGKLLGPWQVVSQGPSRSGAGVRAQEGGPTVGPAHLEASGLAGAPLSAGPTAQRPARRGRGSDGEGGRRATPGGRGQTTSSRRCRRSTFKGVFLFRGFWEGTAGGQWPGPTDWDTKSKWAGGGTRVIGAFSKDRHRPARAPPIVASPWPSAHADHQRDQLRTPPLCAREPRTGGAENEGTRRLWSFRAGRGGFGGGPGGWGRGRGEGAVAPLSKKNTGGRDGRVDQGGSAKKPSRAVRPRGFAIYRGRGGGKTCTGAPATHRMGEGPGAGRRRPPIGGSLLTFRPEKPHPERAPVGKNHTTHTRNAPTRTRTGAKAQSKALDLGGPRALLRGNGAQVGPGGAARLGWRSDGGGRQKGHPRNHCQRPRPRPPAGPHAAPAVPTGTGRGLKRPVGFLWDDGPPCGAA